MMVTIQDLVFRWYEHPLGAQYGAAWADSGEQTVIRWCGPHALELSLSPHRCGLVAYDERWVEAIEEGVPAVVQVRYRLLRGTWARLAYAADYTGPPLAMPDATSRAALARLLYEYEQLRAANRLQRQLLREAHDLLGIEQFIPFDQLPSQIALRKRIVATLGKNNEE